MKRIKIISTTIAIGFVILLSAAVKSDTTPESPIQLDVNQIAESPPEDLSQNSIESRVCKLEKKVQILETQVGKLQQSKELNERQLQKRGELDEQKALKKELRERNRIKAVELEERRKEIELDKMQKAAEDAQELRKLRLYKQELRK